jgi:hypothetical protein
MKRIILVLLALVLALCLASVAIAANPKPVCFHYNTGWAVGDVVHLTFKSMSNATTSEGKVKMYAVHGEHHFDNAYSIPVSGTAHLKGTVLHWSTTGAFWDGGDLITWVEECTWDTATTNNATSHYRITGDIIYADTGDSLNLVNCVDTFFPYGYVK